MMIAAGEQSGARRRAQCSRVESCIAQALRSELFYIGGWHAAAKRAELSETRII
jgi:hypothetical protein